MAVRSNACVFKCLVRISREHYVENDMVLYIPKFSQVREDFEILNLTLPALMRNA